MTEKDTRHDWINLNNSTQPVRASQFISCTWTHLQKLGKQVRVTPIRRYMGLGCRGVALSQVGQLGTLPVCAPSRPRSEWVPGWTVIALCLWILSSAVMTMICSPGYDRIGKYIGKVESEYISWRRRVLTDTYPVYRGWCLVDAWIVIVDPEIPLWHHRTGPVLVPIIPLWSFPDCVRRR